MGRALDVLLVVPNLAGGGAEGAMLRYAAALVKHGHRAQLMLLEAKGDYTAPPGVEIHVLGRSPLAARIGTDGHLAQRTSAEALVRRQPRRATLRSRHLDADPCG